MAYPIVAVSQILRDAADLIERDGWCQGVEIDSVGRLCVLGAVVCATDNAGLSYGVQMDAEDAMHRWCFPSLSASAWNDEPDRTAEEVLAALRGAADGLEHQHGA